jgi:hypothetical protein
MRHFHFGVFMELNTSTSHATSGAKVTSHYWGYRELSAGEVLAVAGGIDGTGGSVSEGDYGPGSNYAGNTAGTEVADANAAAADYACAQANAELTVAIVANMNRKGLGGAGANALAGWCDRSDR